MTPSERALLGKLFSDRDRPMSIGTACSGTDAPVFSIAALVSALQQLGLLTFLLSGTMSHHISHICVCSDSGLVGRVGVGLVGWKSNDSFFVILDVISMFSSWHMCLLVRGSLATQPPSCCHDVWAFWGLCNCPIWWLACNFAMRIISVPSPNDACFCEIHSVHTQLFSCSSNCCIVVVWSCICVQLL